MSLFSSSATLCGPWISSSWRSADLWEIAHFVCPSPHLTLGGVSRRSRQYSCSYRAFILCPHSFRTALLIGEEIINDDDPTSTPLEPLRAFNNKCSFARVTKEIPESAVQWLGRAVRIGRGTTVSTWNCVPESFSAIGNLFTIVPTMQPPP